MTKYIDADALIESIDKINCADYGSMFSYEAHNAARECIHDIRTMIEVSPAADVAEVVHGAWVQERGNYVTVNHCSVCGVTKCGRSRQTGWCDSQYCGACGAKMDLPFVPLERCPGDVCRGVDRSVEAGKVGV